MPLRRGRRSCICTRDQTGGRPSPRFEDFMTFLPRIKQSTDAVVNISTGCSHTTTFAERMEAGKKASSEVCSLNMGPLTFDYSAAAYIERILREIGLANGTHFEFECYDTDHLYTLAYFADYGLAKPPFFIQGVLGISGGLSPDVRNLAHMVTVADSLFGDDYYLSPFAEDKHQIPFWTQSALLGGNVRVGLEDSLFENNADQVRQIRVIVEALGLEMATPAEARSMLSLKAGDTVGF